MWVAAVAVGVVAVILGVGIRAWVQVLSEESNSLTCPRCRNPLKLRPSKVAPNRPFHCPNCDGGDRPQLPNPAGWLRGQLRPPE